MEKSKINALIEQIWEMERQVKILQSGLSAIEYAIVDDVPDEM